MSKEVCWEEEHYMDIWYLRFLFFERRYLWSPPKFYITRTCPRGGHGADATDHSAVGLDQATGRPDKTEHALLAFQKAKENTYNNVKINANTNIDIYKHKGLFQARVRALKTEYTMMITWSKHKNSFCLGNCIFLKTPIVIIFQISIFWVMVRGR